MTYLLLILSYSLGLLTFPFFIPKYLKYKNRDIKVKIYKIGGVEVPNPYSNWTPIQHNMFKCGYFTIKTDDTISATDWNYIRINQVQVPVNVSIVRKYFKEIQKAYISKFSEEENKKLLEAD